MYLPQEHQSIQVQCTCLLALHKTYLLPKTNAVISLHRCQIVLYITRKRKRKKLKEKGKRKEEEREEEGREGIRRRRRRTKIISKSDLPQFREGQP